MARHLVVYDDATAQRFTVPAASLAGAVLLSDAAGAPVWGVGDLPTTTVTAANAQLVHSVTSYVTAGGGTLVAPAPDAAGPTVPPRRFAVINNSGATFSLQIVNAAGSTITLTVLNGEIITFRQVTAQGFINESGNKPLARLDERYVALSGTTSFGRSLLTQADAPAARFALGLGNGATRDVGTDSATLAAGNDSRFTSNLNRANHTGTQPLSTITGITVSATAPSNPATGDVWIDTSA